MIIEKENNKIIGLIGPVHITNSILTKKKKKLLLTSYDTCFKKVDLTQAVIWTQMAVDRKHWIAKGQVWLWLKSWNS